MARLDDYNYFLKNIEDKINQNNFCFNQEEIEVLKLNESFISKCFDILSKDYNYWENIDEVFYTKIIAVFATESLSSNFIFNYYKYTILHGDFILDEFDLSEENINELKEIIKEKLKDPNFHIKSYSINGVVADLIIDANRFDLIRQVKDIQKLSLNSAKKLRDYYLSNNEEIPSSLYFHLEKLNLPLERLDFSAFINTFKYSNIDKEYLNLLIQKLNDCPRFINKPISFQKVFNAINNDDKKLLIDALLKNNYYNYFIDYLSYININEINYEYYIEGLLNAIRNTGENNLFFCSNLKNAFRTEKILNDERIVECLVEVGAISIASNSVHFSKYINIIINDIKINPLKYQNMNLSNFVDLEKYVELHKALIDVNNESALRLNHFNEEIKEYIKEKVLKDEIKIIPDFLLNDNSFINKMIKNNKIENILLNSSWGYAYATEKLILDEESCQKIIEKSKNDLNFAMRLVTTNTIPILESDRLLSFYLNANGKFIDIILNKLNHREEDISGYSESLFSLTKEYLANKHGYDIKKLERFERVFGPLVIRFVDNENVTKILNLDENKFVKFLNLFPNIDFTMVDVEKIYDSIKQYEFSKCQTETISIFADLKRAIEDNSPQYINLINKLIGVMDNKFFDYFAELYPTLSVDIKNNPESFMYVVVNYIKNGNADEKNRYLNLLHTITDYYIRTNREEYRESYNMYSDLNVPYKLDLKDARKQYIKHNVLKSHESLILMEMEDLGYNRSLVLDTINYYSHDIKNFEVERTKEIQKTIKPLITVASNLLDKVGMSKYVLEILDDKKLIKRKYYAEANTLNLFDILTNLRFDIIEDKLLTSENEHIYNSLLNNINKYKIHILPDYFNNLLHQEDVNMSFHVNDIAAFISYYEQIYKDEEKRLRVLGKKDHKHVLSFSQLAKYAETYSSVSTVYNQILGLEDARLIKSDPKPNSSISYGKNERLHKAVLDTINNFSRKEITIPTFNEVINLDENKTMRVVVGNFTHPSNVTMGERTGSCMRIGGLGESLYNFCLEDKNGFHIRFEDPKTGEFISRVSGFRNGNTVFLNELRYSCSPDIYSNEDVVDACSKAAKYIIEKSKDSECPIDNVVLHNAYAAIEANLSNQDLKIDNNKEGLKKFYSDINDRGIVLASTGSPFTKINFDKSRVPIYEPAREISFSGIDSVKLRNMINRVYAMKQILSNIEYEYLDALEFENGLLYGIVNQDWFIYVDSRGKIYEEILNVDDRAKEELANARIIINNMVYNTNYVNNAKANLKIG